MIIGTLIQIHQNFIMILTQIKFERRNEIATVQQTFMTLTMEVKLVII